MSIIYVEDDASSAEILTLYLERQGYKVNHFDNAADAKRALANLNFDLAIFDIMLPKGDGTELLQLAVSKQLPSIMVTAKITESERLLGFDLGADDYVCKPYSPREVVSRVQALLKRTQNPNMVVDTLKFGKLEISPHNKLVTLASKPLKLTALEYALLICLAKRPLQIVSREQLINLVWQGASDITDRTVDTHLANLRKKLADSKKSPIYIATHYGQGYQFIASKTA